MKNEIYDSVDECLCNYYLLFLVEEAARQLVRMNKVKKWW